MFSTRYYEGSCRRPICILIKSAGTQKSNRVTWDCMANSLVGEMMRRIGPRRFHFGPEGKISLTKPSRKMGYMAIKYTHWDASN